MLALETNDLTKDYQEGFWRKRPKRALDHLSFSVQEGEVFGLLGPNGAGKTTTLKILLHLIFPTSGAARLLGKDCSDISVRARVGYLPEQPYFYDHLTASEFMSYVAELFDLDPAERRRRVGNLLERVGLSGVGSLPLRKFSKGMVQRLGIAQALINDPELIFLDEPMSGLDPIGRFEVRDLILELKEQGKTIVFSTHILPDAETLCDRVAILSSGKLQGSGEVRQILGVQVMKTEVVLVEPRPEVLAEVDPHVSSIVRTGERVRLEVPAESDIPQVLGILLKHGTRIASVNPIRMSLEDYFLAKVATKPEAGSKENVPTIRGSA